jgi:TonB family protein
MMLLIYFKIWLISFASFFSTDDPKFKSGNEALNSFISARLIYPTFSKNNCIQGTIYVAFSIKKTGEIYNSKVKKGLGIDLDQEALRLVRLTKDKWELMPNHNEKLELVIPVNFSLKNYNCNLRSSDQINQAIELYKNRLALEKAVLSFYKNKENGNVNQADEIEIIKFKNELGFDDNFINKRLKEAKQKLKQGDKESACEDFYFVKYLGSTLADDLITTNCK